MIATATERPAEIAETVRIANLQLWEQNRMVRADGAAVRLTRREFDVLMALAERAGRVVQREEIYDLVWGWKAPVGDRSVDVYVRRLREKLAAAAPAWRYLHTRYGIGYRLNPERIS